MIKEFQRFRWIIDVFLVLVYLVTLALFTRKRNDYLFKCTSPKTKILQSLIGLLIIVTVNTIENSSAKCLPLMYEINIGCTIWIACIFIRFYLLHTQNSLCNEQHMLVQEAQIMSNEKKHESQPYDNSVIIFDSDSNVNILQRNTDHSPPEKKPSEHSEFFKNDPMQLSHETLKLRAHKIRKLKRYNCIRLII